MSFKTNKDVNKKIYPKILIGIVLFVLVYDFLGILLSSKGYEWIFINQIRSVLFWIVIISVIATKTAVKNFNIVITKKYIFLIDGFSGVCSIKIDDIKEINIVKDEEQNNSFENLKFYDKYCGYKIPALAEVIILKNDGYKYAIRCQTPEELYNALKKKIETIQGDQSGDGSMIDN